MSAPARAPDGRPATHPTTRRAWRRWLIANHATSTGVWLVTYKKATGKPRVDYADAVEEALCFGWVDSKPGKLDDERSLRWMSPRSARSWWSRINKERVGRLEHAGLMTAAGRAVVDAAKRSGTWIALDAVEALDVPDDLTAALASDKRARANFQAFPPSSRKIILTWIASAKRPATRGRRVDETVRLAAENIRANHYRQ